MRKDIFALSLRKDLRLKKTILEELEKENKRN